MGGRPVKRAYSSLACMDATVPELIRYAVNADCGAVEIRLDKDDNICGIPREALAPYLAMFRKSGIEISDLGTGIIFMDYEPEKIERAKRNAALAAYVGAKGIRLFLGGSVKTVSDVSNHDVNGIIRSLKELNAYARTLGVALWLETHSAFSSGACIRQILDGVQDSNVKVIWDVLHSMEFGEAPEETVRLLGDRIVHVHIKDGVKASDPKRIAWDLTALGDGALPIGRILKRLRTAGFAGYLSLEWESAWHPELNAHYADIPTLLNAYNRYLDQAETE